ncbi:SYTL1 protein, partial [Rhinopomastus cyanomelas]|nr:SYTL1 protein [Rhinopomastus cyanomelas]
EVLLDLSFLTDEERQAIADVLRRDWQLRRREEGRISKLRKLVSDPARLRILTGDWFCDARAQRHQYPLGSDLVRASIRRRRRPRGRRGMGSQREGSPSRDGGLSPLRTPMSPGAGDLEDGSSLGELEAIGEPLVEEKEDEDGATEPEESPGWELGACTRNWGPGLGVLTLSPSHAQEPRAPQTDEGSLGRVSPQNSHRPPDSLLTTSSSVSSLSSSTLSSSLMSLYSEGELGKVAVRGCVQFSLRYEPATKELQVHVLRCRELAEAKKQRSDPYIKTYLLPDKSNRSKRKTSVRKRSLDPIFNETLKYKLEKRDLQGRTLNLSVWHHDSLGRNLFLGEVEIALGAWDWANTSPEWFSLQPRMPISSDGLPSRGNLNLALKFIPAGSEGRGLPPTGELHIWVKDAQSLIPLQSGTVDAFVQCYVLPDDSKASRQKTRVVKRSLNPLFNHTMVYDGFQAKDLAEACAEFTLWHHEAFAKRQLGGIRLSLGTGSSYGLPVGWMDSTPEERGVWGRLLQRPGQWVEALLPLRTNLVPR